MKVAFVASEGVPFSKTGGLADVVGALPKALAALGHEVEVICLAIESPRTGAIVPHAQSLTLPLGSGTSSRPCRTAAAPTACKPT